MMCVDPYEINPPIYGKLIKNNKCVHTNGKLENKFMYLYQAFQFEAINASTTYTNYQSRFKYAFITCKIHVHFVMRKS